MKIKFQPVGRLLFNGLNWYAGYAEIGKAKFDVYVDEKFLADRKKWECEDVFQTIIERLKKSCQKQQTDIAHLPIWLYPPRSYRLSV